MKVVIVHIQEMEVKNGLQDGGWYYGRQFFKGVFGRVGQIISDRWTFGSRNIRVEHGEAKILTEKELRELLNRITTADFVFKEKEIAIQ